MSGYCTVFGIDSHARVTTVCAMDASTGEVRRTVGKFPNRPWGAREGSFGRLRPPHKGMERSSIA